MANAPYAGGLEGFLDGSINWSTGNIKAVLVDLGAYALDLAAHRNLSDIPAGARIATSANLGGKTVAGGVADAADAVFAAAVGAQSEAVVLYQDSGVAATSRLIAYIDTASGLPVTPNGADITVAWDNGANKIFKL